MSLLFPFLLLLLTQFTSAVWRVPLPASILHPPRGSARSRAATAKWADAAPPAGRTFSPIDYGGDPTGLTDSTAAVAAALTALLNSSTINPVKDAQYTRDCGGASLDLQGGEYVISASLVIPSGYGNLRITQGTLRASPTFPRDAYLLVVGNTTGGGTIDLDISGLFFDAYQVAAGCIYTNGVQGAVIGPQVRVANLATQHLLSVGDACRSVTATAHPTIVQAYPSHDSRSTSSISPVMAFVSTAASR